MLSTLISVWIVVASLVLLTWTSLGWLLTGSPHQSSPFAVMGLPLLPLRRCLGVFGVFAFGFVVSLCANVLIQPDDVITTGCSMLKFSSPTASSSSGRSDSSFSPLPSSSYYTLNCPIVNAAPGRVAKARLVIESTVPLSSQPRIPSLRKVSGYEFDLLLSVNKWGLFAERVGLASTRGSCD